MQRACPSEAQEQIRRKLEDNRASIEKDLRRLFGPKANVGKHFGILLKNLSKREILFEQPKLAAFLYAPIADAFEYEFRLQQQSLVRYVERETVPVRYRGVDNVTYTDHIPQFVQMVFEGGQDLRGHRHKLPIAAGTINGSELSKRASANHVHSKRRRLRSPSPSPSPSSRLRQLALF